MSRDLFGTDGVRGLAGQYPLDEAGAQRIGMAIGAYFGQPGQTIVIGYDPRQSSNDLVAAVSRGLSDTGVNVLSVGVLPTPGLAYITREGDFAAGVMITASHNPVQYNGIKAFDSNGDKLSDATEAELNELIEKGVDRSEPGKLSEDLELPRTYENFLIESADGQQLTDLKIVVDSANGAASGVAERVFSGLGASVTAIFDKPNGLNINDGCGATNTTALAQTVIDTQADLGVALDGDADRVILIDGQGRELNGDHILYILALSGGYKGVVCTVMSNLGLENALKDRGIDVARVQVGDRYVLEGFKETGYNLGGEHAGHIILPDLLKTGDGLLAAVQTLLAVKASGKSLAQWRDELALLPQALVNIELPDKSKLQTETVKNYLAEQEQALNDQGRLLVRPSGTEPLARVMVEASDADSRAEQIANQLNELVKD
jgi:phosphoglucosamine mutase